MPSAEGAPDGTPHEQLGSLTATAEHVPSCCHHTAQGSRTFLTGVPTTSCEQRPELGLGAARLPAGESAGAALHGGPYATEASHASSAPRASAPSGPKPSSRH